MSTRNEWVRLLTDPDAALTPGLRFRLARAIATGSILEDGDEAVCRCGQEIVPNRMGRPRKWCRTCSPPRGKVGKSR